MRRLREQVDLQALNTLGLPARARWFSEIDSVQQLAEALGWAQEQPRERPLLILGGGSNVVLADDWPGLVLRIDLRGMRLVEDDGDTVVIEVAAGENWHALVQWTLAQGYVGLENLTLIPGTAGAAPIQNIGAYGVELADHLVDVRGWSLVAQCEQVLPAAACEFGYRDSVFKGALRDGFVITAIRLRLRRRGVCVVDYPALRDALMADGIEPAEATAAQVEQAVRLLRSSKLPDPAQLPNAGSFFKNPVVDRGDYMRLQSQWPTMPGYPTGGDVKVPAGWLVEQAGWKGRRCGAVGVHTEQALVLVHFGGGSGADLLALAEAIQSGVMAQFGIPLEIEPRVYSHQAAGTPPSAADTLPVTRVAG